MINYYTRTIKINEIKINDYININGLICKILSVHNNNNVYSIEAIDETLGNDDIHKCLYDMNKPFFKNKKFTKCIFVYKYEIWRIQDFLGDGIEYLKKEKIEDNFITYKQAEIYAIKYINNILDEDIAPYLDEIIIMKSTDYIDNEISKLFLKLS
jgi:hypothetical protein